MRHTAQQPMPFVEVFSISLTTFVRWGEKLDGGHQLPLCDITNFNRHVWHSTRYHRCHLQRGGSNRYWGEPTFLRYSSFSYTDIRVHIAGGHGNIFRHVSDKATCRAHDIFWPDLGSQLARHFRAQRHMYTAPFGAFEV